MSVMDDIIATMQGFGYKIATQPQEKPDPRQVVIELDTIDLKVETPQTYRLTPKITMFFMATSGSEVLSNIKKFIPAIEKNVHAVAFKFNKPEFMVEGRAYYVALPCEYTEVIQIE